MENRFYTDERGQQIVITLLKAHGIKKVVASPGTTNITLVASMQHDPWFEMYSSVDERSAAYIACGLAAESGEAVVLSCTGATASRNYMPGLTEAYYRKLPIIAITATQGNSKLGHLIAQNVDRRSLPNDIALCSVYVPIIQNTKDEKTCELDVNYAILETKRRGGGPVHINLQTGFSVEFPVKELPSTRVINRVSYNDEYPLIPKGKVAVYVGSHSLMTTELTDAIDNFCATYDSIVLCDHTSGYHGKYRVNYSLISRQYNFVSVIGKRLKTMIHIGEISANRINFGLEQVWRVSEDGEIRDTFGRLRYVFEMSEISFFSHYAKEGMAKEEYLKMCKNEYDEISRRLPDLPFSNIWMAQQMSCKLPTNCVIHLGIQNSLRSWNFFEVPEGVTSYCNVGGFGIDGNMSTLLGASFANPNKLFFGIFGDLAFFYDMNSLGNRHLGKNIRIMLVNNGLGAEMTLGGFKGLKEDMNSYIVAAGHYGNQSPMLVRHYAEDLGFSYLSASNKDGFHLVLDEFTNPNIGERPILLECFVNYENEGIALELMSNILSNPMKKVKNIVRKAMSKETVEAIKRIMK